MTGKELKKWRLKQKMTREAMSKKFGFNAMHIYKMETGRAKVSPWLVLMILGEVSPNDRTR